MDTTTVMDDTTTANGNATAVDLCEDTFLIDRVFTFFYLFPLLLIVLLMSFFKKRKHLWPSILKGRPGILYPINFIDEYARRWMYCAVFLLLAFRILYLFNGKFYFSFYLPPKITFLKVFVTILNVIILCMQFYPMAACIVMRKSMIANVLGILLTFPWLFIFLIRYAVCPPHEDTSETHETTLEIIYEIPLFIALGALIIGYSYDLYLNIKAYRKRKRSCSTQNGNVHSKDPSKKHQQDELCLVYIRTLFQKRETQDDSQLTFKEKLKKRFTYVKVAGFQYPPRVICTVVVGLFALYKTGVATTTEAYFVFELIATLLDQTVVPALLVGNGTEATVRLIRIYSDAAKWGFTVCAIISFVVHVCLMVHFILQYRNHIRLFFAGDHRWHYNFQNSPASVLVAGMRYSGYQVAFLIYGYIIMTLVLFLLFVIIVGFIIIPLATKTRNFIANFLISQIEKLWPTILIGLVISFSQTLLAKFAFLQDRGAYVALNNRRVYHVASFFLFFFNVVLGIFSCLKRILFSMIFGTLLISRLDRNILMRGFEQYDSGFNSYLSMLTVDVYHNHPILKGFVYLLQEEVKSHKEPRSVITYNKEGEVDYAVELSSKNRRRIRNKYWKLLTLMHNPSLVLERMKENIAEAKKNNENDVLGMTVDTIGGAGTAIIGGQNNAGYAHEKSVYL